MAIAAMRFNGLRRGCLDCQRAVER
jgi:hypothetical protein